SILSVLTNCRYETSFTHSLYFFLADEIWPLIYLIQVH
ncbi:Uncharacterized protein APZ42_010257, partial [Daphnia magna]